MGEKTHKKSNWLSTPQNQDSALKLRRFSTKDDKDEEIQQFPDVNRSKFSVSTNPPFPDSNIQRQEEGEKEEGEEPPGAQLKTDTPTAEEPEEIQTKLTVGQPGDKYEQEADTVAAKVVEQINSPQANQPVQGKIEPVVKPTVMRQGGAARRAVNQDVEQNIQQARGSGQGLAENVRQPMEQAFDADFSGVKVHTDGQADVLNRSLNSRAFATGQDIFFKQGEYQPGSKQGQELLAHELTHVVQQGADRQIQREGYGYEDQEQMMSVWYDRSAGMSSSNTAVNFPLPVTTNSSTSDNPWEQYSSDAYGIMNSCMTPSDRTQSLVNAANLTLGTLGVPPAALGRLPSNEALGEMNFTNWSLDLNQARMSTNTPEERADVANTVGHEAYHMYQWYEMARLQSGLGKTTKGIVPPDVNNFVVANPILQSNEHTAKVQEWYESVYGSGRKYREDVLGNSSRDDKYCKLPEERDAWALGRQVTSYFRNTEGLPLPAPKDDLSLCNPKDPEEVRNR